MEISKQTMKKLILLITFTVLLLTGIQRLDIVLNALGIFWGILFPLVLGGGIAFVINVPMHSLEEKLFAGAKKKKKLSPALARCSSLLLTFLLLIAVILLLVLVIVPQLLESAYSLGNYIAAAVLRAADWAEKQFAAYPEIAQRMENLTIDWKTLLGNLWAFLTTGVGSVVTSTISVTMRIFGAVNTAFIALIFAVYLLLQKERLGLQCRKALYALVPRKAADQTVKVCSLSHRIFSSYIAGQCMEAVILGCMFFVSMSLLKIPYALLTGCLIAVTALIPIVGAFIGCFVGAFLLLMVSPMQAVFFVALFLVLQQVEGNFIYPHVVGNSVGLPSIWVLAAVTVGGSLMGVAGMILFIPLTSVVYALFREFVYTRLKEKGIKVR
ncbi:MAG: AI-2E family transporter [Oscillospiraceae bacterium]|jgi:predicted PurR-regulated permease PerM|nr:AI-2E family transporter [Oscillospiraceae bacterium]MDE6996510.1 AI-2E family transporter [Oscillospiraceae bacterium]